MMRSLTRTQQTVYCCKLLLILMQLVSAQDVVFSGNSSRVIGHGVFSRSCEYTGTASIVRLNWLLNEILKSSGPDGATSISLTIDRPTLTDQGEYSCEAILTGGNSARTSAGFLNLYREDLITVPATQQVLVGDNINLQCSSQIPGTSSSWREGDGSSLPSGFLSSVSLEDQGQYDCTIIEVTTGGTPIFTAMTQLQVIVPPTILSTSPIKNVYSNEPETFTVSFMSSFEADTNIIWLFNNNPLTVDQVIVTRYSNETTGTTSLEFSQLTRANEGRYTVVISNSMALVPMARMRTNTSFTVDVIVPPAPPSIPRLENFNNNTRSRITWNLTNETADAGPESLIINIMDHPISPVKLDPAVRMLVIDTEPGAHYVVSVTAINIDGQTNSQPADLILPSETPRLGSLSAIRLNATAFNFTLEVTYTGTGGGELRLVNIRFREAGTSALIPHDTAENLVPGPYSRIWYAVVTNSRFAMITEVEFLLTIQNRLNLEITMRTIQVIVIPGPPKSVIAIDSSANSLTLQACLSTSGTAPIFSAHFVVSGPGHTPFVHNITNDLFPGGVVEVEVGGLSPSTSYSVVVYATNAAGRGQNSVQESFSTRTAESVLPLWIILVIAVVGSLTVLILLLLLLISCCYRRHGKRKINISAVPVPSYHGERPGPLGKSDSIDSVNTSSNYYNQKDFILGPPPTGFIPILSPSSNVGLNTPYYNIVKPHLQNSISESDTSEHSSKFKHFNFHHSPVGPSSLQFDNVEYDHFRSMPILDDPDLSPTMPPNCATDV